MRWLALQWGAVAALGLSFLVLTGCGGVTYDHAAKVKPPAPATVNAKPGERGGLSVYVIQVDGRSLTCVESSSVTNGGGVSCDWLDWSAQ